MTHRREQVKEAEKETEKRWACIKECFAIFGMCTASLPSHSAAQ